MKKYQILLVFIVSFSFGYGQRYNVTELSTSENKYTLNGAFYSGKAYSLTKKAQLKEEFTIENGMLNGLYELYKIDDNYTHSKYKDTLLISRTIKNIEELELKIKELQKDSIRKLDSVWIQEEELLGGRVFKQTESVEVLKRKEKLKSIEEKYANDKLNNKKKIEYDNYIESQKEFTSCLAVLIIRRSEIKQKNEVITQERGKPMFQNLLSESFYYVVGNQTGLHSIYDKNGNKEIEETLYNGKKDGAYKKYSGTKIIEQGNYLNNEKEGEWITQNYGEKITQNYSKGKLNGAYKKYDGDILLESGQYLNGLKNGEWKNYDKFGKLILLQNFQFDKLSGVSKEYSSLTSNIIFEINYNENIVSGIQKGYYSDKSIAFNSIMNSTELNNAKEALRLIYTGEEVKLSKLDSTAKCFLKANEIFKLNDFDLRAKTIGDDLYAKYKNDYWGLIARLYEIYLIENDDHVVREKYKDVLAIKEAFYSDLSSDIDKLNNELKNEIANSKNKQNTPNYSSSVDNLKTYNCKGHISKYEYNSSGNLQIQVSSVKCGACGTTLNYGNGWFIFEGKKEDCNQKEYVCKGGIGYSGCGVKNILLPCNLKVYSKGENF